MSSVSPTRTVQNTLAVSQFVPVTQLRESPTNPRKHFDMRALGELAASIKDRGVLQPLLVRPLPKGKPGELEIVAGARRYRATKMAGLSDIPVIVKNLTDEEVVVIQLIENAQREDLSPGEEADAYAALAAKGLSPAQIAEELKKDRSRVAKYLKLAGLAGKVKEAMASGVLPVDHALAIARIPDPKLQEAALGRIVEDFGAEKPILGVVPLQIARRIIEEEFMTDLSLAFFDPEDATLSPLGPCSKCPYLSGNDRDLFGDVKGRQVCTNPKDFRLKTENHLKGMREKGHLVLLTPKELKRAYPYPHDPTRLAREFVNLESVCPEDPKRRTYEVLLGKGEKLKTVFALRDGKVRRLYPAKDVRNALATSGHHHLAKKADVKPPRGNGKDTDMGPVMLERRIQAAVSVALAAALRTAKLNDAEWWDIVSRAIVAGAWNYEPVFRRHGYQGTPENFAKHREAIIAERLKTMSLAEKRALAIDFLVDAWGYSGAGKDQQAFYAWLLKRVHVDKPAIAKGIVSHAKLDKGDAKAAASGDAQVSAKTTQKKSKK
jgi:ParB/RepB/Spo0J family partition protein